MKTVVRLIALATLALEPSNTVAAAPDVGPSVAQRPESQDLSKATDLVIAEAIHRINDKRDTNLAFALGQMHRVKQPEDVAKIFQDSLKNGQANVLVDRNETISLIKLGVSRFTSGASSDAANKLIDGANAFTKWLEAQPNQMRVQDIPPLYTVALIEGAISGLSPEIKRSVAEEVGKYVGRTLNDAVRSVREHRLLNGTASNEAQRRQPNKTLDQQLYDDQIKLLTEQLSLEKETLEAIAKGQLDKQKNEARRQALHHETERLEAGVYITGLVLGPLVGSDAANKVTRVGQNFIRMNQAVQQFGPGGITPDKLLMFTNFVSAGMAVAQIFVSQQDPTMLALTSMMHQLKDIQESLNRIENKTDHISDLILYGFERVLQAQEYTLIRLTEFETIVKGQVKDQAQRDAIKAYLDYVSGKGSASFATCANPAKVTSRDAENCLEQFANELSTDTLFSQVKEEIRPAVFSPSWSNQMLSVRGGEMDDQQLVLEQLSYPLYFSDNPIVFRSMIARNHEAVAAYIRSQIGLPHPRTVANPEVLISRLKAYLAAAGVHQKFRTSYAKGLTEQAIRRVEDIENVISSTLGNSAAMDRLWAAMERDLKRYEASVLDFIRDLDSSTYAEERARLNSAGENKPELIKQCGGEVTLPVPRDPASKIGVDKFVPQIYWLAQEMGLGTLGQCFEWSQVKDSMRRPSLNSGEYYQINFKIKIFFNPAPKMNNTRLPADQRSSAVRELDKNSIIVSTRNVATKYHYTTFYGTTAGVFSRAWVGTAAAGHDVLECEQPFGRIGRNNFHDRCYVDPKRFIPVQSFVAEAVPAFAEDDAYKGGPLERAVKQVLADVVKNRSGSWNEYALAFKDNRADRVLVDREVMKANVLGNAIRPYEKHFLAAKGLLLLSYWHVNPISKCLAELESYSPEAVVETVAESSTIGPSVIPGFREAMKRVSNECKDNALSPEIRALKSDLEMLLATQVQTPFEKVD